MSFSFSTLLTTTVFCNIVIINLFVFTRKKTVIKNHVIGCILLCVIAVIARMFLPFEIKTAAALPIEGIFPDIVRFVNSSFIMIGEREICIYHVLYLIWIAGAATYFSVFITRYVGLRNIMRKFPGFNDERVYRILNKIILTRRRYVNFHIVKAPNGVTPFIIGYRNPIIVLPDTSLSDDDLLYVLTHETTHYYNGDIWLKTFLEILCMVYWWNPIVFMLKRHAVKILEVHTDLSVVRNLNKIERIQYLESIINIAKKQKSMPVQSLEFSFTSYKAYNIERRIRTVIEYNESNKLSLEGIKASLSVVLITALFILCSFMFTLEPYFDFPYSINSVDVAKNDEIYFVENPNGGYDLYFNNEYVSTVQEINEDLSRIHIYKNLKEALK